MATFWRAAHREVDALRLFRRVTAGPRAVLYDATCPRYLEPPSKLRPITRVPTCIYCRKNEPSLAFSNEHVLTRAFSGSGVNWTLVDMVCKECNELFSRYESHWSHSAVEAMMRNFSGPMGPSGSSSTGRSQPIDCEDLYIIERDDELVYEAGFAYPNQHYFRPQFVLTDDGLLCLSSDMASVDDLRTVLDDMIKAETFEASRPATRDGDRVFEVATLKLDFCVNECTFVSARTEQKSRGYWVRPLPRQLMVDQVSGVNRVLTPRCALDDRKRLYFRAHDWDGVVSVLSALVSNRHAVRPRNPDPKQTVAIGIVIKLPIVFRAVMKTGLNFVAKVAGAAVALDPTFDRLRWMILDAGADNQVVRSCRFLGDGAGAAQHRTAFPSTDADEHRLMLDEFRGAVRFRLRLYGHMGYECILAKATPDTRRLIGTRRAVVDFVGDGIRSVSEWQ